MKKIVTFALLQTIGLITFAQSKKSFEGTVVYKIGIKSKEEGTTERDLKKIMVLGDSMRVSIKNGNYRQHSGNSEIYYIAKKERIYVKFRGIDTLYYREYDSDTSTVTDILKTGESRNITGYACKAISIVTPATTRKYYYSPDIYMDPTPDLNDRVGRYDVFAKETSSLCLEEQDETKSYLLTTTCTRLQQEVINDSIFQLPSLPEKKFTIEAISISAEYKGSSGWIRYLQTHMNADLGVKYIKLHRGESMATQTVMVGFIIDESGKITNVKVLNKDEVHPKLAEEAVRVISESPSWRPATILGERVKFWFKQPLTFAVTK